MNPTPQVRAAISTSPASPLVDIGELIEQGGMLYDTGGLPRGALPGWPALDELYSVSPGQWTVVTGTPGSGKSEFVDALLVNLAESGDWEFCIYSPENYPIATHLVKLVEKRARLPFGVGVHRRMTRAEYQEAALWVVERFFWVEPTLKTPDEIIATALRYRQRGKSFGIVLDPWNTLEHQRGSMSETDYVSFVLTEVTKLARSTGAHIWLVVHPAKMLRNKDGTRPVPTPYDISGCHSADTEVLTTDGWVPHPEVTEQHKVCCFDMEKSALRYEHPSKVWVHDFDGEMVRLEGDSFDALVTSNHRLVVKPVYGDVRKYADSGKGRPLRYTPGKWGFVDAGQVTGTSLLMPWATKMSMEKRSYSVEDNDWLRFLGWWIAEGYVSIGGLGLCQADGPLARRMEDCLITLGVKYSARIHHHRAHEKPMWVARIARRGQQSLCDDVIEQCGAGAQNKKVPLWIWRMTTAQKDTFLDALIDGDGHRPSARPGTASYTTVSPQLANDVQRLAIECGRMAVLHSSAGAKKHHKRRYEISIGRVDRNEIALRMSRHVRREQYSGKVYCLTVPTGAYLVRRNGKPGIYGNSAHWYNKADNILTVHRDQVNGGQVVELHVQKIRFKHVGHVGLATLRYDKITGRYFDLGFAGVEGETYTDPEARYDLAPRRRPRSDAGFE